MAYENTNILDSRLLPKEETLELQRRQKKIVVGIPKESNPYEYRIPLTPLGVQLLTQQGHQVIIEHSAGDGAKYTDNEYSEAGANITTDRHDVFECDVILKVGPLTMDEISMLKGRQVILTSFNITSQSAESLRSLMKKKVTAIAFEFIQDDEKVYPVVRSMSEIAGSASILIAAQHMNTTHNGKGVLLGGVAGVSPTEVMILGAGTTGEYAARAALGLGAVVKVFDNSIEQLRKIQRRLGQQVFTSVFQPTVLAKNLRSADVVIGALSRYVVQRTPDVIVTEEMVMTMKKGSVIVDISVDNGACFETSRITDYGQPSFTKYGVVHVCVPNIASSFARTASIAFSNLFTPIISHMGEVGGVSQQMKTELNVRKGVYIYHGILTNGYVGKVFDIPSQDIDLLMVAFE